MLLAHRIRLVPTKNQRDYFVRAAGTARRVWNWALAEWHRQRAAGAHPNAMELKRQFNAIKYKDPDWLDDEGKPWLKSMHRDSHSQPFAYLARAWSRFFDQLSSGAPAHPPRFKKKGHCPDSFYVANDKFSMEGLSVVLPKIGRVKLTEALRFRGKIMGATIQREADHWYVSVQVALIDADANLRRRGDGVIGVDLGILAAATLCTGEKIPSPKPLKGALRRLRIRSRRVSRKLHLAQADSSIHQKGYRKVSATPSRNHARASRALARLHARIAAVRNDFTHKLTTRLCRENQAIGIEDLNVSGMLSNRKLARALSDINFGKIRTQLTYKAYRYGTNLILADRWFPSTKLCSACGWKNDQLSLGEREWLCKECETLHDRDHNAAINLRRLATGVAGDCNENALPVASRMATFDTAPDLLFGAAGKVTLVRNEFGQQDGSGQEEDVAPMYARFRSQQVVGCSDPPHSTE